MIQIQNLTKDYGQLRALDNVSFTIQKGEIVGFLGPNGAGKTTTLKIMTCFMPPNSGNVYIDDLNIYQSSIEVRKKIGYLPEGCPLYGEMNVVDFLKFVAELRDIDKDIILKRVREMIQTCGLQDVVHKEIGELSKGYRQRVGLAAAMIHNPKILILDEPTTGLDPNQIVEIRELIKRLGREKTVLISTHILREVEATCDRVIIIDKGKIVADGPLAEIQNSFHNQNRVYFEIQAEKRERRKQMSNILAICKKEIRAYFYSPVAYILIALFLVITGWFFGTNLFLVNEATMRNIFSVVPLIFIFFIPAVTMKTIAEEKRSGTIELLCTTPVTETQIILGKFFASIILLCAAILSTLVYVIILAFLGAPDGGTILAGYIGLILMGAAYSAIGIFSSTISANQIVAFIISFFIIIVLFLLDKFLYFIPIWLGSILQYISIDFHFQNIAKGVIDSRDIIYYLSVIFIFLFFACNSLYKRKYL